MLRGRLSSTSAGDETRVIIEPCEVDEVICGSPRPGVSPMYTLMYETFFTKIGMRLPLSDFECDVLKHLHLAPTQLHPNGWAFVRSFAIVCRCLGLDVSRSIRSIHVFFSSKSRQEGRLGLTQQLRWDGSVRRLHHLIKRF